LLEPAEQFSRDATASGIVVARRRLGDIPIFRTLIVQTDPTIDPVADPANQPLDEPGEQPRPLPGVPPETDPLAPGASPDEEALRRSQDKP
jgi:hypothetical protein